VDLVIEGFMAEAERRVTASTGPGRYEEQWKITKRPQHINLEISPEALDFIQRGQKTVKIGGPLFFGLRIEWK